ncbi:MAG TPA: hypothetical protein DIS79_11370 [Bacteroidetes bacterium]|nr:hypothetical protein [Bacteroidota bacterium]HRK05966.1 hypothetical protein [Chlorobiota bacterium]
MITKHSQVWIYGRDLDVDMVKDRVRKLTITDSYKRGDPTKHPIRKVRQEGSVSLEGEVEDLVSFCEDIFSSELRHVVESDVRFTILIFDTKDFRYVLDPAIMKRLADLEITIGVTCDDIDASDWK